jgi:rhamnosyltransferase
MNSKKEVQHVYLVGAKSLGAYGGYETFVYKLTEYHQNKENIKYHVACKANGDGCMDESKFDGVTKINDHEFEFHNAHCFKIDVPQIGPAQAIYYDVAALKACCEHIKKNHIPHPIVYIMACRIGPFASHFYREIHKLGGTVYLNPDGECEIIRGCHNRDKGTAENERLRNLKFIFSYPKNERLIFLGGRNAAQEEISTMRVG